MVATAGASTAGTWLGTITLADYPCGAGSCPGTFDASLVGSAVGTDAQGHPFTVTWPDPTAALGTPPLNLAASFQYSEACPLGATGAAGGSYTVTGGLVEDNGVASHNGTLTGQFDYLRVGATFAITTSAGDLYAGSQLLAAQAVPPGVGTGVFVPNPPPTTCLPGQVGQITAEVAGTYGSPQ